MPFYKDLPPSQREFVGNAFVVFVCFLNLFLAVFAASYGVTVWRDITSLIGEDALTIPVSGEGRVTAIPDVARFTAGVTTERDTLAAAQAENAETAKAIVSFLTGAGIVERDIRTTDFAVQPQYVYPRPCAGALCPPEAAPRIIGYRVRNAITVTVRELTTAGELIGGVVAAGANEVSGISFTIDDPSAFQAEARKEALDDARRKAERLAKDLARHVGRMVSFSEGGVSPYPLFFGKRVAADFGGEAAPAAPPIQPGENEIVATVSVVYLFE